MVKKKIDPVHKNKKLPKCLFEVVINYDLKPEEWHVHDYAHEVYIRIR